MKLRIVKKIDHQNEQVVQLHCMIRGIAVLPNGFSLELTRIRDEYGCRYFLDSGKELPYVTSFIPLSPSSAGRTSKPTIQYHEPNTQTAIRIRL